MHRTDTFSVIKTEKDLREIMGETMEIALQKNRPSLDQHSTAFISRSPFLCISTSNSDGKADVSPRGDPNGFVQVLDDKRIYLPDRPGNNRLDTMTNIIENPNVGLLFFIPGFSDTLRINGRARIVQDDELAQRSMIKNRIPKVGILVQINEVFLHCAKAILRSGLWNPDRFQDRREMPTLGQMILDQVAEPQSPPTKGEIAEADDFLDNNYKTALY